MLKLNSVHLHYNYIPLFVCFVDRARDLYLDRYLDIHFASQKSAVGKLEHSVLLMLNLWDFCIQIWVWMRSQPPRPSLTTQSWSWKDLLNIETIPFALTGVCFMSSGETEGSLAVDFLLWTLSKVLIFSCLLPNSLWFLPGQVPQTQNCKAFWLGGQKAWNNTWENILSNKEC